MERGLIMTYQVAVSKRIIKLCQKHNLSLKELAKETNIPHTTLNNIVNCKKKNIKLSLIQKICTTLKMELKDFFNSNLFDLNNLK